MADMPSFFPFKRKENPAHHLKVIARRRNDERVKRANAAYELPTSHLWFTIYSYWPSKYPKLRSWSYCTQWSQSVLCRNHLDWFTVTELHLTYKKNVLSKGYHSHLDVQYCLIFKSCHLCDIMLHGYIYN